MKANNVGKVFAGKFVSILLKSPKLSVHGYIKDQDDVFIYLSPEESGDIVSAVAISNIGMAAIEDEVEFLMDMIDVGDKDVQ